ncbi:energy-coupling factor transporter ATPase [Paratractidigestivibacter sp.]|uniref:ABC transporter ATP-binding protein n=1 Tax=Paratractidigestivibacter sp. TaxID=2847316 RepID=UPI002ABDC27D|nr:energy-coupling factor transporter ATPase [Paratractidigestivibacter sp.]
MSGSPIKLEHVTLRYGDVRALDDVTLEVATGQRVCVLGANGSGKSTLASVICGLLAPDEGAVELVGERVRTADGGADLEAYRRVRRELGLVFQNPDDQIVTSVVADDVAFGPENLGLPRDEIRARVERELRRVALLDRATSDPSRMSGGQRQRVCIAGALAMEPQVLVLDEPSSLLDVRGREAILRVMGRLAAAGTTLVHVTHFMDEALEADRVIVMERGRIALDGVPEQVFCEKNAAAIDALGLELPFRMRLARARRAAGAGAAGAGAGGAGGAGAATAAGRPSVCEVRGVGYSYGQGKKALDNVTFSVRRGESVAIVGQTGSGKSTLLRLMCGLEVPDAGSVSVAGASTAKKRGRREVRRMVGYVMQHPERQLFAQTVAEDVAFGPRNLGLSADEVTRRVDHAFELVGLGEKRGASPFELSGGQRRLAAIAGVLAMEPELLILDEPTAGLDPRGRARLRELLADLRGHGVTLVQVTHSMDDAARADRVVVLDQSRVIADGAPAEVFSRANEAQLRACGLGIPKPLAHARGLETAGHAPLGDPPTIEALAKALNATEGASGNGI